LNERNTTSVYAVSYGRGGVFGCSGENLTYTSLMNLITIVDGKGDVK